MVDEGTTGASTTANGALSEPACDASKEESGSAKQLDSGERLDSLYAVDEKLSDGASIHVKVYERGPTAAGQLPASILEAVCHTAFPSPTPRTLVYNKAGNISGRERQRSRQTPSAPKQPADTPSADDGGRQGRPSTHHNRPSAAADRKASSMRRSNRSSAARPSARRQEADAVTASAAEGVPSRRARSPSAATSSQHHIRGARQSPASHVSMTPRGTAFNMHPQRTMSLPVCPEDHEGGDPFAGQPDRAMRRTTSQPISTGIGRQSQLDSCNPYGLVLVGSKPYEYNQDRSRPGDQLMKSMKALASAMESKLMPSRRKARPISRQAASHKLEATAAAPLTWSDFQNSKPLLTEPSALDSEAEWAMNDYCGRNEAFDALATPRNGQEGRIYLAQYTRVMLDLAERSQKAEKSTGQIYS